MHRGIVDHDCGVDLVKKKTAKYKRCKKCKELVIDAENCANCAAKSDPLRRQSASFPDGRRSSISLDMQEGNWEEYN